VPERTKNLVTSELYADIWTHDLTSVKQEHCPLCIQICLAIYNFSGLIMSEIVINVCQYLQCGVTWPVVTCDVIAPSWWFIVSFVINFPVCGRHDALFLPRICPIVVDIKSKIVFRIVLSYHVAVPTLNSCQCCALCSVVVLLLPSLKTSVLEVPLSGPSFFI